MRLDKFLKVSRLIKRRTVANEACDAGRVLVNGTVAKASVKVKVGDIIEIQFGTKTVKAEVLDIQDTTKKYQCQIILVRGIIMEIRMPKAGDKYRHFKGNLYEVIIIARDSETLEEKVVYKEVNGDAAYVRSLPMFVSPVDKEKYPDVTQEYRFQLIEEDQTIEETLLEGSNLILPFLELDAATEKIKYLQSIKEQVTGTFLEIVAQSLDFVENPGTITERYEAIILYLMTIEKYEKSRLR